MQGQKVFKRQPDPSSQVRSTDKTELQARDITLSDLGRRGKFKVESSRVLQVYRHIKAGQCLNTHKSG